MTLPKAPRKLPEHVERLLDAASARYGIRPALARGVAWTESKGDQTAVGTSGERGVMQLMAATAKGLGVDPAVLEQNIDGGVRLLAGLVKQYGEQHGLASYNAGPRYGKQPPEKWPASTQQYVPNVLARAELETHFLSEGVRIAAGPFEHSEPTQPQSPRSRSSPPPSPHQHSSEPGKGNGDDK